MASKKARPVAVKLQTIVGHVIVKRRQELGLSQADLAKRLHISRGSASKIEAGQVVSLDQLWQLSAALGTDATQFISDVQAVADRLRAGGVNVLVRRGENPPEGVDLLPTAALAGLVGYLAAQGRR